MLSRFLELIIRFGIRSVRKKEDVRNVLCLKLYCSDVLSFILSYTICLDGWSVIGMCVCVCADVSATATMTTKLFASMHWQLAFASECACVSLLVFVDG